MAVVEPAVALLRFRNGEIKKPGCLIDGRRPGMLGKKLVDEMPDLQIQGLNFGGSAHSDPV